MFEVIGRALFEERWDKMNCVFCGRHGGCMERLRGICAVTFVCQDGMNDGEDRGESASDGERTKNNTTAPASRYSR